MQVGTYTSGGEVSWRRVAVYLLYFFLCLLGEASRSDAPAAGWSDAELRNLTEGRARSLFESKPEDQVDVFGGVRLGESLDKKGYQCKGSRCEKAATIAGIDGYLQVDLCGSHVRTVTFTTMWIQADQLPAEAVQDMEGVRVAQSPRTMATREFYMLRDALVSDGWNTFSAELANDIADGTLQWFERDSICRTLRIGNILHDGRQMSLVMLQTANFEVCTDGL